MMRVCVVTPFHAEPAELLARCTDSVARQSHACDHLMVADGASARPLSRPGLRVLDLGRAHGDYGNTPRGLGALLAVAEGYDAIALLDADNWYDDDHIARCVAAARAPGAEPDAILARRRFVTPGGDILPIADEPDDTHCDTSCFFVLRGAFHLLPTWTLIPPELADQGDRVFYRRLRSPLLQLRRLATPSVSYTTRWPAHYQAAGLPVPDDSRDLDLRAGPTAVRAMDARGRQLVWRRTGGLGFDPPLPGAPDAAGNAHAIAAAPRTAAQALLACGQRQLGTDLDAAVVIARMSLAALAADAARLQAARAWLNDRGLTGRLRGASTAVLTVGMLPTSDGTAQGDAAAALILVEAVRICAAIQTDDAIIAALAGRLGVVNPSGGTRPPQG